MEHHNDMKMCNGKAERGHCYRIFWSIIQALK